MNGNAAAPDDFQFFLSYSRRDALEVGKKENEWFVQFRQDLLRDVAREAHLPTIVPPERVGFYDRENIHTGDHWTQALADGLQTSRVIVCMFSANYFLSPNCGREFQVFLDRVAKLPKQAGAPAHIIPVLWDAPNKLPPLPPIIKDLQFEDDAALGTMYAENGLMVLLRMKKDAAYDVAYQKFLLAIAGRIAAAAKNPPPRLAKTPAYNAIASAFHPSATKPAAKSAPPVKGVKIAWLVYAAGGASEYPASRTARKSYGASGGEWMPFLPDADALVGAVAANVASAKNLSPYAVAVSPDLVTELRKAEDSNTMVVVIVDPWSVEITSYEQAMRDLDQARLTNCGIIIVWSDQDPETLGQEDQLRGRLQDALSRTWISKDVFFQESVRSEQNLRDTLGAAIEDVKRRIGDRGRLLRGKKPDVIEDLPMLPAVGVTTAPPAPAAPPAATR